MKRVMSYLSIALMAFFIAACSSPTNNPSVSADDIIAAFKEAGLEAENARDMTKDDYGMAPMKAKEAKRFFVPSLGEDAGGRLFIFDNQKDLEDTKKYYDELGKQSAMFFSWTYAKGNILIQMNGDMEESQFNKYKEVLDKF